MNIRAFFLFIPLSTALLYACSDEHAEVPSGYADVTYVGDVTDEALVAFGSALDQKAPVNDATKSATLDAPAEGAVLPKSPPAAFTWHIGATASRAAPVLPSRGARRAFLSPAPKATDPSFASPLRELFGPVRAAHAHGTPFTGTATFLVFAVDSNTKLVRVLTSETSYTPAADAWSKLAAAGKPITLTLVTADFEQNRVLTGGGPFAGTSTTFTIAP